MAALIVFLVFSVSLLFFFIWLIVVNKDLETPLQFADREIKKGTVTPDTLPENYMVTIAGDGYVYLHRFNTTKPDVKYHIGSSKDKPSTLKRRALILAWNQVEKNFNETELKRYLNDGRMENVP